MFVRPSAQYPRIRIICGNGGLHENLRGEIYFVAYNCTRHQINHYIQGDPRVRSVFWKVTVSAIVRKRSSYEHVSNSECLPR